MVQFCEGIVEEIQLANDPKEVDEIIRNAFARFKESKSHDVSKFIINMIVMLRISVTEAKTPLVQANTIQAISIFRKCQGTIDNLF